MVGTNPPTNPLLLSTSLLAEKVPQERRNNQVETRVLSKRSPALELSDGACNQRNLRSVDFKFEGLQATLIRIVLGDVGSTRPIPRERTKV